MNDKDLHKLSTGELGKLFPVIIVDPDSKWGRYYETEKNKILQIFHETEIEQIDHIGSTAIPNLRAKPVIDILLQVAVHTNTDKIIQAFTSLGYQYTEQPDNPPPYMMFLKGYTIHGYKGQAYHVHVRYKGVWNEICFRDFLKKNKDVSKAYEELKNRLSIKYRNDREAYTEAKTEFIENINNRARNEI